MAKEKVKSQPNKPNRSTKNRQREITNKTYNTCSFDSLNFLKNPVKLVVDCPIEIDTKLFPESIDIICSLEDFKQKDFPIKDRSKAVIHFYEQALELEERFCGEFIQTQDYPGNTILQFKQDILREMQFLPYDMCNISLKRIWLTCNLATWLDIICPILYDIGGHMVCGLNHFIHDCLRSDIEMLEDDPDNLLESPEDAEKVKEYYDKYGDNGTLQKHHPELFKVYSKKGIEKAWALLAERFWKIDQDNESKEDIIIVAFFNLFSIRNSQDHIENYVGLMPESETEEIRMEYKLFFYWDNDRFTENNNDNFGNNQYANQDNSEPYQLINLTEYPKLSLPDTTFISAVSQFAHKIVTIYDN